MKFPGYFIYRGFQQGLRSPQIRPWILLGLFAYLISPFDLLPSFLPGLGEVDDLVLVGILVRELLMIWWENLLRPAAETASAPATGQKPGGVIDVQATPVESE
ncbi:MAG: DUF1232 domain-containing protein [Synechococcaceae cyanobacterium SM2_3_1]|nr:DUF1232 domain-containing protein [Synechococcaceae cyanobacterium SM2_3_1]